MVLLTYQEQTMNRDQFLVATAVFTLPLAGVLSAAWQPAPKPPPAIRVVVLPFQNATGEAEWDDWCHALAFQVRSCLNMAEFTEVVGGDTTRKAIVRAGGEAGKAADIKLVRQVAGDFNADFAVWGSFRRRTNEWTARVSVLRLDTEAAPTEIEVTA